VGYRQIFIRFSGCNLSCAYCDTPVSRQMNAVCRVQEKVGEMTVQSIENPVSVERLVSLVEALDVSLHHSVSFTGGEPLLQAEYVQAAAGLLRQRQVRIYLETNGTLPDQLTVCRDCIDIIAMDWKAPGSTGGKDYSREHMRFLREGRSVRLFVKLVVAQQTPVDEVEHICELIASENSDIPLVLQPVSEEGSILPPRAEQLFAWHAVACRHLRTVRIVPQMHRLLKVP